MATSIPVTGTGVPAAGTGGKIKSRLTGWYFTETGGSSSITVTLRQDNASGVIIQQLSIAAGKSVGESGLDIDILDDVHVTVSGSGTCQGALRGF